jgi:hypothetical protein
MRSFIGNLSKRELLTLVGAIAAVLVVPLLAKVIHGDFASSESKFERAAIDDLAPDETTCLDGETQVIPAGIAVCATLHGSWLDGRGPFGPNIHEAMAIWTRQAHAPFAVLTLPHAYQRPDAFKESVDYVVCVEPPSGVQRAISSSSRMTLDVVSDSPGNCPGGQ